MTAKLFFFFKINSRDIPNSCFISIKQTKLTILPKQPQGFSLTEVCFFILFRLFYFFEALFFEK